MGAYGMIEPFIISYARIATTGKRSSLWDCQILASIN